MEHRKLKNDVRRGTDRVKEKFIKKMCDEITKFQNIEI